jgi:hypothetical protein
VSEGDLMQRKLTITVSEQSARWVRRRAAAEDTSVSKLVDEMKHQMAYCRAYKRWKKIGTIPGVDATNPSVGKKQIPDGSSSCRMSL